MPPQIPAHLQMMPKVAKWHSWVLGLKFDNDEHHESSFTWSSGTQTVVYTGAFSAQGVLSHVLSRRHVTSVGTYCSTNATSVTQSRSPASNLKTHTGVKQMQ